jgi:hypothetical protein
MSDRRHRAHNGVVGNRHGESMVTHFPAAWFPEVPIYALRVLPVGRSAAMMSARF